MAADGLSDNTVLCGLRDSYGFMWLGTNNGLNRFDGSHNTVFRNIVDEKATYENNIITSLFEYSDDIWFGGSFGLYCYDRDTNVSSRFVKRTKYGVNISSTVKKIVQAQNGTIWIITLGQGLFIYDPKTEQLTQDSRHSAFISDIIFTDNGDAYLSALDGNIMLYRQTGEYVKQFNIPDYQADKNSICLEHYDNMLFIGTEAGLYQLREGQSVIERIPLNLPYGGVRSLCMYTNGDLLLGTEWGIFAYQTETGQMTQFDNPGDPVGGLSDNVVNQMIWDTDNTLWVMTDKGGVCYMTASNISLLNVMLPTGHGGQKILVNAFCESDDGNIWVGSATGLYYYNRDTQQLTPVNIGNTRNEIQVLMTDGDDLWIGTHHNGIIVMNTKTQAIRKYQYSASRPYTVTSNDINCLLKTSQGDIYVGTSWSLCRYDRQTENFMWYAEIGAMTNVTDLAEDSQGRVWATSSNHGLFRQTGPGQGFINYTFNRQKSNSIANNYTTSVFCDHQGTVWVATKGDGIYYYDAATDGFIPFGTVGSISQDQQTYFITEDQQYNLWIGVENGMARINAKREANSIQSIGASARAQREQKPYNAVLMTKRGEMFIGCNGDFLHFYPEAIQSDQQKASIYIMSVILPNHNDDPLQKELDHQFYNNHKVSLSYDNNSFTVRFSSPTFRNYEDLRFEYMLTGIDKDWSRPTKNGEATYAGLPPGDYEFLVRQSGNGDPSQYARLSITVRPPWYRTNLAYVIYVLLILLLLNSLIWRYTKTLRSRYSRRMEEFRQQQEKENFESKIQFFINLVHEIRTPLSLISLPLEALGEEIKTKGSQNKHIAAIRRNMNYLLGITNQLLDFQKAEKGQIHLSLQRCNVNQLLTESYHQFEDAMKLQNKRLQLQLPADEIYTNLDSDKVQKVMMNLIGNAFKYAKTEIILRLEQTSEDQLCIAVIDDGPGIPPAERDKIFDAYYQIAGDSTAKDLGTGLGLPYAKMLAQAHGGDLTEMDPPGGGSDFRLTLPINLSEAPDAHQPHHAQDTQNVQDIQDIQGTQDTQDPQDAQPAKKTSHRVLVVEDNEELLQMTCDALKRNYHITKARDGVEALDVLKYNDVDIIVSDVMMPRMDGITLCQRVKNDINFSHIPVILLTAKTSVEAKLEGMQSGADIYLEKPFSARQLHLQISSLLRMRQHFHERMQKIENVSVIEENTDDLGMNQQNLMFMERLQQMVDENLRDEEFSIDQLAEQMNMSRSSFYRKIKALTDMTPIDYMKSRRLERAALLLNQGVRISDVAEQVGFTSSSYFAKCFKGRFGVLPKEYLANKDTRPET